LYGACGPAYHPDLARVLLEAGANPDDGESLYHSTERRDHACTRLLLEHGARITGTNALAHMLDFEDLEGAELFIAHGADAREWLCGAGGTHPRGTLLHHAVERGRSLDILALLVRHGVEVEPRRELDGRTAFGLAVSRGRRDQEQLLRELGAQDTATPADRFLGACARGDAADARARSSSEPALFESLSPGEAGAIADAAERGDVAAVALMLDLGFDIHALGGMGGTPLHQAAIRGQARVVELLLARGAEIERRDSRFDGTPLGWAVHGCENEPDGARSPDWIGTVSALLEHGARSDGIDPADLPPELADILRRHGARDRE
jgi:ankyrin repeat protein